MQKLGIKIKFKVKPIPTKEELRAKRLEKRKTDLLRYHKRKDYFNKLYSNKIKKANKSIVMLERSQSLV